MDKVLIAYREPSEGDDKEILEEVENVVQILSRARFRPRPFAVKMIGDILSVVKGYDGVFNLFESPASNPWAEVQFASLLETIRVPFTGSTSRTLSLANSKLLTKQLLREVGLPVCPTKIKFPMIVKPSQQDASEGVDQGSVVNSMKELQDRVDYIKHHFQNAPAIVEQYIAGREFMVNVISEPFARGLPAIEMVFEGAGRWPIATYDSKWLEHTAEFKAHKAIPTEPPVDLYDLAVEAFRALGCRDYASVDFRISAEGKPYILEVNANCDISPKSDMAKSLTAGGYEREVFITDITYQMSPPE